MNLLKKIGNYAFVIGIILIFIVPFMPNPWDIYLNYVSIGCFIIGYMDSLIREWEKNHKIALLSIILFFSTSGYLILTLFCSSPYISLFGQAIIYMYLLNSGKQIMGHYNKTIIFMAIFGVVLNYFRITYSYTILNIAYICYQVIIIFKFLDPILEKIALDHRAKRLAAAESKKELHNVSTEEIVDENSI